MTQALESLKNFHFNGLLWAKYILFELEKNIGIIFYETEEGCRIWRGISLSFKHWHKELVKIWPEHSKVSNTFILMGFFWAKYIFLELKENIEIIFHETEEGTKIWGGIDLSFQNWHEKFDKFWPEDSKVSTIFILMGSFWAKYILFELKKYRRVIFHETEEGYRIWRGIDLLFQIGRRDWTNFNLSTQKSQRYSL